MKQGDTGEQGDTAAAAPTILQVVQSAYGWANGDVEPGVFLAEDECYSEHDARNGELGDGLLEFLIRELGPDEWWMGEDAPKENGAAHLEQARNRMQTIFEEVQSVYHALFDMTTPQDA